MFPPMASNNDTSIRLWLNAAGRYPLLPTEELLRLCRKRDSLEKDSKAYLKVINKICLHNLKLIPVAVKRYVAKRGKSEHREMMTDLFQLGYMGLRRAAEKFDGARGYAFATYAMPWIRQSVYRGCQYLENMVYIPEGLLTEITYISRNGGRSSSKNGKIGEQYLRAARHGMNSTSYDAFVSEDETLSYVDTLSDDNKILNENYEFSDRTMELIDLLSKAGVAPREIDVVMCYVKKGRMSTVAQIVGLPSRKCRTIYNTAIDKLKKLA